MDSLGNIVGSTGTLELKLDGSQGRHEFIIIGSRRNQFSDPMLLLLQIEWRGNVAYRVNSGEINEDAWETEDHTWKLIALR